MAEGAARPASAPTASPWRAAAAELGFVAAYVFLDWISYFHEYASLGITPWNPHAGLALAWLIRRGPARGLSLFAAVLAGDLAVRDFSVPWQAMLATAAVIAGAYTALGVGLKRLLGFDPEFARTRDVVTLLAASAAGAAVVALATVALFQFWGALAPADFRPAALRLWVGDIIGIAVVAPAALRARRWRAWADAARAGRPAFEALLAGGAIGGVLWVVFGLESTDEFKFFYLLFLPLVSIAVMRGIDGACAAALVTQLGILLLAQHRGFSSAEVTDFQLLLLALVITGLLTGAAASERRRADDARAESERQLRERQSELEHSARLAALGEMASALAHELNQPMTASRAYIRAAQRLMAAEDGDGAQNRARAAESVTGAVAQIDLAAGILRNLRELVRPRALAAAAEPTDVGEIIDQSLTLLRAQARAAKAEIAVRAAAGLLPVMAERVRVQQVILNLARNALDAVKFAAPSRRRVEVTAAPAADGRFVEIAVRDHGPGVPAEIAAKLFTAFATTKPEGLGLGLSISRGIVADHGGRLWLAHSGPDGAEFRFTLPVSGPTIRE
ncbi:MAG: ATP-binding protein [Rhodospirillales bacterium]